MNDETTDWDRWLEQLAAALALCDVAAKGLLERASEAQWRALATTVREVRGFASVVATPDQMEIIDGTIATLDAAIGLMGQLHAYHALHGRLYAPPEAPEALPAEWDA